MIEGLKPYAEYKESGLPWLDAVPKHWDMAPNRALMRDQRQVVGSMASDYTLLSLTLRGVIARDMVNPKGKFPARFNTYKMVNPDDFVFCLFDIDETPRGVGLSPLKGMITGAYDVFSPTPRINPRFLYHYYLFVDEGKLMKPLYTGLRKTIQRGVFASLKAPLPPPEEQAAIVRFLDHANRKIDGFIRAKRKLIGLLNEQKQAIIHRAVTRGLDPNVPLKPSGIPWLGDIPEHWDTPLLGRCLTRIEQGWSPVGAEGELGERQWCVLTLSAVRRGVFNPEAIKPVSTLADIPRDIEVANGDLLLTRSNTRDRVGDVCLAKDVRPRTLLCDLIYRLTLGGGGFVPQFLVYQLLCPMGRAQIEKDARGSSETMPKISQSHIKSWRVLLPPPEEQQAIVELVAIECRPLTTAIARTEREIALMLEYRTRLTADIVTGKLDVRAAAENLPEIPSESVAEEAFEGIEDESFSQVEL